MVRLDNRRRMVIVKALRQYASSLDSSVTADRHKRLEMDADTRIAEMLAVAFEREALKEAGRD